MARTGPVEVVLVYGPEELTNYLLINPADSRLSLRYVSGEVKISPKNPDQPPGFKIMGSREYQKQVFEYPITGVQLGKLSQSHMLDGGFELLFCSPSVLGEKINGDAVLRTGSHILQEEYAKLAGNITRTFIVNTM